MKYGIVNCDIFTGEKVLYDKAIIVEGERIKEIVDIDRIPSDIDVIDLKGLNIAPGFIDLQVNGGGGYLFNDNPSEDTIQKIYEGHKKFGTVNFLPTIFTMPTEKIFKAIKSVSNCIKENKFGVLGLHIEGPYINKEKAGVHDKNNIKKISDEELDAIIKNGRGVVKLMTIAPEVVKKEHVKKLTNNDIVVSAGHTLATYEETMIGFDWGITCVTHLFNAMSQFNSRSPGVVGAAYDSENVWASIIVDGFHVHFASVRISKIVKKSKLFLITDSMPPVGSDTKKFRLGDLTIMYKDGRCMTKEGILAGSGLDMSTAIRNCVQKVGITLDEALRMASTYPAEVIHKEHELGKIKPGYLANMTIFNNQIVVKGIVQRGQYEEF